MKLGHDPIKTPEVDEFIDQILKSVNLNSIEKITQLQYDQSWRHWLTTSYNNTVSGLGTMPFSTFSAGTTPAFGEFIARHHGRRVRASRSDFALTRILCKSWNRHFLPLEDSDLDCNDCVIISLPFSGNGKVYPAWDKLLDQADQLNVPVFLDAAYFGISHGVNYDLDRKCISDFVVSLTKNLTGNCLRLGVRFTREQQDDGISASAIGSDIFDRLGSYIAVRLLERFPHDWFIHRHRTQSQAICKQLGLSTTNVLSLALGTEEMKEYRRGDFVRVCISDELSSKGLDLMNTIK